MAQNSTPTPTGPAKVFRYVYERDIDNEACRIGWTACTECSEDYFESYGILVDEMEPTEDPCSDCGAKGSPKQCSQCPRIGYDVHEHMKDTLVCSHCWSEIQQDLEDTYYPREDS